MIVLPWAGLAIAAATVVVVFGFAFLVNFIAQCAVAARDALRDRYVRGPWNPGSVDILGIPVWAGLEFACLAGGLVFALLMIFAVASLASDVRDWWHKSDRGR